jgi:hypothetical protein
MCTRKIVGTILAAAFLTAPVAAIAQPLHFHPGVTASADSRIQFNIRNTDSIERSLKINGELYRFEPNMQRTILAPVGTRLSAAVVLRSYSAGRYAGETVHNVTAEDRSKTFDLN